MNTRDVITFQGKTVNELKKAFRDSINEYLAFCEERNKTPEKPFSGKLNLRLSTDLHRKAYIAAKHEHVSLNQWIAEAISLRVDHILPDQDAA